MSMTSGFLKFNNYPNRIYVTADDNDFDEIYLQHLREEGFVPSYLPLGNGGKDYRSRLRALGDGLELAENYALIAFGDAAAICLEHCIKPQPHCVGLVAYYPTTIGKSAASYPVQLEALCHLAGTQGFAPAFKHYSYPGTKEGFAEYDLMEYNAVAGGLSWSRTLGVLRKAFKVEVDLERVWEEHMALEFQTKDAQATMGTMVAEPYVNHIPTLTGGIGRRDLTRFYSDYFIPGNPPSLTTKLVSRTMGVDRVVDEMIVSFKHTQEVPWMLPDVPATGRVVHVALVSVVCIRGGKLYHEHIYWDQASVLVQVGLLDPKMVPDAMRSKGLKQLPVYGSETAAKVLDNESQPSNALLSKWAPPANGQAATTALPERPKQAAGKGKGKKGGKPGPKRDGSPGSQANGNAARPTGGRGRK